MTDEDMMRLMEEEMRKKGDLEKVKEQQRDARARAGPGGRPSPGAGTIWGRGNGGRRGQLQSHRQRAGRAGEKQLRREDFQVKRTTALGGMARSASKADNAATVQWDQCLIGPSNGLSASPYRRHWTSTCARSPGQRSSSLVAAPSSPLLDSRLSSELGRVPPAWCRHSIAVSRNSGESRYAAMIQARR